MDESRGAGASCRGRIAVFAGTTEGRRLVEHLSACGVDAVAFVATSYGASLIAGLPHVRVCEGRLDAAQMALAIAGCSCAVDATHPFALQAHRAIREAAASVGSGHIRLARPPVPKHEGARYVADVSAAVDAVAAGEGAVLLATGSKELAAFTGRDGLADRLYPRVLPDEEVIAQVRALGVPRSHIIAMQGPFSLEFNIALLKQIGAAWLVTKESGAAGGQDDKIEAALGAGAVPVVIERPAEPADACDFERVCLRLTGTMPEGSR